MTAAYGPRSTNLRSTRAEMADLCAAFVAEIQPATARQVYHQAVSRGLIDKTEPEYKLTRPGRWQGPSRSEGDDCNASPAGRSTR